MKHAASKKSQQSAYPANFPLSNAWSVVEAEFLVEPTAGKASVESRGAVAAYERAKILPGW